MYVLIATHVAALVGGAVLYHFYATKVLGYVKQTADAVKAKI